MYQVAKDFNEFCGASVKTYASRNGCFVFMKLDNDQNAEHLYQMIALQIDEVLQQARVNYDPNNAVRAIFIQSVEGEMLFCIQPEHIEEIKGILFSNAARGRRGRGRNPLRPLSVKLERILAASPDQTIVDEITGEYRTEKVGNTFEVYVSNGKKRDLEKARKVFLELQKNYFEVVKITGCTEILVYSSSTFLEFECSPPKACRGRSRAKAQ